MKMKKVKVKNMVSSKGNPVVNQFVIETARGKYFQSYDSTICFVDKEGKITLDKTYWDFSRTTGKYRNIFLNECKKETEKR
jgi:hypothetical protein